MLSLGCAAYSSCLAVKNGYKILHSCKSAPLLRMMQIGASTLCVDLAILAVKERDTTKSLKFQFTPAVVGNPMW